MSHPKRLMLSHPSPKMLQLLLLLPQLWQHLWHRQERDILGARGTAPETWDIYVHTCIYEVGNSNCSFSRGFVFREKQNKGQMGSQKTNGMEAQNNDPSGKRYSFVKPIHCGVPSSIADGCVTNGCVSVSPFNHQIHPDPTGSGRFVGGPSSPIEIVRNDQTP